MHSAQELGQNKILQSRCDPTHWTASVLCRAIPDCNCSIKALSRKPATHANASLLCWLRWVTDLLWHALVKEVAWCGQSSFSGFLSRVACLLFLFYSIAVINDLTKTSLRKKHLFHLTLRGHSSPLRGRSGQELKGGTRVRNHGLTLRVGMLSGWLTDSCLANFHIHPEPPA